MMQVSNDDINTIVTEIWSSMLGLDVGPNGHSTTDPDTLRVAASVQITGAWNGAVEMQFTTDLARVLAEAMLGIPAHEASDEDVADVVGELANMAGGNLKTLAEGTCALSLPTVTEGRNLKTAYPGATIIADVGFECAGSPFKVAVVAAKTH
jgi:chemotaxis protein CheX